MGVQLARAVIAALILVLSAQANAQSGFVTGNDLKRYCEGEEGSFNSGLCFGFITGVIDGDWRAGQSGKVARALCAPSGVTNGQLRSMVEKYLKENPQLLHGSAGSIVLRAIGSYFPCR